MLCAGLSAGSDYSATHMQESCVMLMEIYGIFLVVIKGGYLIYIQQAAPPKLTDKYIIA